MNNKKRYVIFGIVALVGVILLITSIILLITGFGDFESNNYLIGMFLLPFSLMAVVISIVVGFRPLIMKRTIQRVKKLQEEMQEDLTDMATLNAQINSQAVKTTVKAVKEGLKDVKFCPYCGAEMNKEFKFCPTCGKEQI